MTFVAFVAANRVGCHHFRRGHKRCGSWRAIRRVYLRVFIAQHCNASAASGKRTTEVQAEPLVTMGSLARLLLVAGGFLGMEDMAIDS